MEQTLDMTLPQPPSTAVRLGFGRRLLLESGYSLSAFFVALPALVVTVAGLSVGLSLLVVVVGLPVLAATVYAARVFAHVERRRLRSMLGREAPSPAYLQQQPAAGWLRRTVTPLRDPQSWLDVVWGVVGVATGGGAFAIALGWWAATLGGLTYWVWERFLPQDGSDTTLAELLGLGSGRTPEIWLNLAIGVAALATLPVGIRFSRLLHASLAEVLLCSRAELQREVQRAQGGRAASRAAEADALRRLERDIHDGPQQRLVRLSMDLGRARRQLEQDPATAGETLDAALRQARDTVDELRNLSRGIAPPILVDRGLAAALEEVCARSEVPVAASLELPAGLPPHVETAVYFVVSEALTNVAKHSGARATAVNVSVDRGRVLVRVEDDGVGGAHLSKGHGLAGLEQRVRAVDGTLSLSSPVGGPTVLGAEIACV